MAGVASSFVSLAISPSEDRWLWETEPRKRAPEALRVLSGAAGWEVGTGWGAQDHADKVGFLSGGKSVRIQSSHLPPMR